MPNTLTTTMWFFDTEVDDSECPTPWSIAPYEVVAHRWTLPKYVGKKRVYTCLACGHEVVRA